MVLHLRKQHDFSSSEPFNMLGHAHTVKILSLLKHLGNDKTKSNNFAFCGHSSQKFCFEFQIIKSEKLTIILCFIFNNIFDRLKIFLCNKLMIDYTSIIFMVVQIFLDTLDERNVKIVKYSDFEFTINFGDMQYLHHLDTLKIWHEFCLYLSFVLNVLSCFSFLFSYYDDEPYAHTKLQILTNIHFHV